MIEVFHSNSAKKQFIMKKIYDDNYMFTYSDTDKSMMIAGEASEKSYKKIRNSLPSFSWYLTFELYE